MKFFKQIDSQSAVNKMVSFKMHLKISFYFLLLLFTFLCVVKTAKNIAIVMAPVICRSEVARLDLQASSDGNAVVNLVELMILEHETIFQVSVFSNKQKIVFLIPERTPKTYISTFVSLFVSVSVSVSVCLFFVILSMVLNGRILLKKTHRMLDKHQKAVVI
jgi:hypothetical protein